MVGKMGIFMSHRRKIDTSVLSVIVGTSGALAAPQGPSQDNNTSVSKNSDRIEEITVAANKRVQKASDVGLTIVSVNRDQLTKLGITDIASLTKVTPGLTSYAYARRISCFLIAGVNFDGDILSAQPAVSAYIDDAPLPYPALAEAHCLISSVSRC